MPEDCGFDALVMGITLFYTSYLKLRVGDSILLRLTSDTPKSSDLLDNLKIVALSLKLSLTVEFLHDDDRFTCANFSEFDCVVYGSQIKSLHKRELLNYIKTESPQTRFYRVFDFSPQLFKYCFSIDQSALQSIGSAVLSHARSTKIVRVTSECGTDLTITVDSHADWTHSFGLYDGVVPGVFPPGEVNTFSEDVSGIFVADGALNMSFDFTEDVRLCNSHVILSIDHGRIVKYQSANILLATMCEKLLGIENGSRVGEIGFGTNEALPHFVPFRSHINERAAGFHIGCGSPIQKNQYVSWKCPVHIDFISTDVQIYFDDVLVFTNQRWLRSMIKPNMRLINPDLFADAL